MKNLAMKSLFLTSSMIFASSAFAQFSITPRVGHSYKEIKTEAKFSGSFADPFSGGLTEVNDKSSSKEYDNTHTMQLDLTSALTSDVDLIGNIGYTPYYSPNAKSIVTNFEVGARKSIENLYGQASIGIEHIKLETQGEGSKDFTFVMPTLGIGAGYIIPLINQLSLDIFYRGRLSLAESKEEKFDIIDGVNAKFKIASTTTHEAGLGLKMLLN